MISLLVPSFAKTRKFIPTDYKKSIYDIDFDKLYAEGKRVILTDLDNTLISYRFDLPDETVQNFLNKLQERFEVVLVSNSMKNRVKKFADAAGIPYVYSSGKPRRRGLKKAVKLLKGNYSKDQMVLLGDQIMTDSLAANRFGIDVILVDAIDRKTEKWYTKVNRQREKRVMKKIIKKHNDLYTSLRLGEKK